MLFPVTSGSLSLDGLGSVLYVVTSKSRLTSNLILNDGVGLYTLMLCRAELTGYQASDGKTRGGM